MARLTVYGSCVSRDAASVLEGRSWSVERYIARQSLISAGTSADVSRMDLSGLTSAFVRRSFLSDAAGDLEAQLAEVARRTDILLWDLTDERLGVIETAPGCFLTRSTEGMTARLYEWAGDRLLELGTDGHLHQWERALPGFRAVLERCGLLERTVLLNAPWALRTAAGEPTVSSWGLTAQEANCMIAEYVEEVRKELPVPVLRVPDELVVADTRHRWGAAPFHYAPGLYEWVANQVEAAHNIAIPRDALGCRADDGVGRGRGEGGIVMRDGGGDMRRVGSRVAVHHSGNYHHFRPVRGRTPRRAHGRAPRCPGACAGLGLALHRRHGGQRGGPGAWECLGHTGRLGCRQLGDRATAGGQAVRPAHGAGGAQPPQPSPRDRGECLIWIA